MTNAKKYKWILFWVVYTPLVAVPLLIGKKYGDGYGPVIWEKVWETGRYLPLAMLPLAVGCVLFFGDELVRWIEGKKRQIRNHGIGLRNRDIRKKCVVVFRRRFRIPFVLLQLLLPVYYAAVWWLFLMFFYCLRRWKILDMADLRELYTISVYAVLFLTVISFPLVWKNLAGMVCAVAVDGENRRLYIVHRPFFFRKRVMQYSLDEELFAYRYTSENNIYENFFGLFVPKKRAELTFYCKDETKISVSTLCCWQKQQLEAVYDELQKYREPGQPWPSEKKRRVRYYR